MKAKKWIIGWIIVFLAITLPICTAVVFVDPFFHFHAPDSRLNYRLDNQRSQNPGIVRHFEYENMITGTSMTENFKATEAEELLGGTTIKVCFSGATYKELHDIIVLAADNNPNLKRVICSLDMSRFNMEWDVMATDLGIFPEYLYDDNPLNDVDYLLNSDVLDRTLSITLNKIKYRQPGITSFDDYSRWQDSYQFGYEYVCPNGVVVDPAEEMYELSSSDVETVRTNIEKNIVSLAQAYPDVEFYFFYPPYSIVWWNGQNNAGSIVSQLEAERIVTEMLVGYDNVHLFSFNTREDIVADLDNYKDETHYAEWVNSMILECMSKGEYRLTKENFEDYLEREYELFAGYDYEGINEGE